MIALVLSARDTRERDDGQKVRLFLHEVASICYRFWSIKSLCIDSYPCAWSFLYPHRLADYFQLMRLGGHDISTFLILDGDFETLYLNSHSYNAIHVLHQTFLGKSGSPRSLSSASSRSAANWSHRRSIDIPSSRGASEQSCDTTKGVARFL